MIKYNWRKWVRASKEVIQLGMCTFLPALSFSASNSEVMIASPAIIWRPRVKPECKSPLLRKAEK